MNEYRCKYFTIQELVSKKTYDERGEKAWQLLDANMLIMIDNVRDIFGRMIINNWNISGNREWSGLRTPDSPFYSTYSQHSFGRAFDMIPIDANVHNVRQYIIENPHRFKHIGGIENGVPWLHIDGRNYDGILQFTS